MQKNLKQIMSFLQVVDSGSFTKAADTLGLSRAMVSIDVKQLEQQLNASLLIRNTRSIALTEVGAHFYADFKQIQQQIEQAFERSQHLNHRITGVLRFSSTNEFGKQFVLPLLGEFCRQYPQLRLQYSINSSLDDLISEKLDVAIRLGNLKDSSFKTRKIGAYAIYLVATPQYLQTHPIDDITDLAQASWIEHSLLNWQDSQYYLKHKNGEKHVLPWGKSSYQSNSSEVIRQMTLESLGISICPAWLIAEELQHKRLIRLLPEYDLPQQNIQFIYPNTQSLASKTRVFMDFLSDRLHLDLSHH